MKKILCFFLLIVFLCGCSAEENKTFSLSGLSFTASVNSRGRNFKLNCDTDAENNLTATVIYPESLKGMCITVSGENINVQFMGVSYDKKASDYPAAAFVNLIFRSAEDVSSGESRKTFNGEIKGKKYELIFSDDGTPASLSIPTMQTEIKFSNVILRNR